MSSLLLRVGFFGVAAAALSTAWSCASPDNGRVDPIGPDATQFKSVAPMLVRRCGTIECHGSHYRNMRVYGYGSQRLEPNARPDFPTRVTDVESAAAYDSIIGLEPELMRDVVNDKGADPERLTLVRKAKGLEQHKGDQRIVPGDDADKCLLGWLANATDIEACDRAGCVGDGGIIGHCNP